MRCNRFTKPTRMIAGLLFGLLFAISAIPLGAQPAHETRAAKGIGPVFDSAHETTLHGTIQTIVTKRTKGTPAGMHLLVMGPEGLVDAHIGSFLNKDTKASFHEGDSIQIVGAMTSVRGKSYLMARQLTVGNHTVTVRSQHGLLAPTRTASKRHSKNVHKSAVKVKVTGGAQ